MEEKLQPISDADARAYLREHALEVSDDPRSVTEIAMLHRDTGSTAINQTGKLEPLIGIITVDETDVAVVPRPSRGRHYMGGW